jgi:hypothetical protein
MVVKKKYGTLQSRSILVYMLYEKCKSTLGMTGNTHIKHDCAIYGGEVNNMGLGSPNNIGNNFRP